MTKSFRYGLAVLFVVVALTVRLGLDPVLGSGDELLVFTLAILMAARFGGAGPGIAATSLSLILAWFFFIHPRNPLAIVNLRDLGNLFLFAVAGAGISLLVGRKRPGASVATAAEQHRWDAPFFRRTALLGLAFFLLAGLTHLLNADFEREKGHKYRVTHTYDVINQSQALASAVEKVETEQRNFLLIDDKRYLELFQSALEAEQSAQLALLRLTADNPAQQARLDSLDHLVKARFSVLQKVIATRQKLGLEAALDEVRTGEGEKIMDQCRETLHSIESEERHLVAQHSAAADSQALRTRWILGSGSGLLLLLLVVAGAVIERDIQDRDRVRQALRKSKERLHLALDSANAGAWEWDPQTNEKVWSDELWKVYGLEPHSCPPSFDAWRQLIHPDDRAEVERVVGEAVSAGAELTVEFRICDRNGGERWLLSRARPLRDAKGQTQRFVGIAVDITQRKLAEEALREREQNLRRFTEAAPVPIAMFDLEMRYLAASQRFRDDFHLGGQELVGRSQYDVFPDIPDRWREVHRRGLAGAVERHDGEWFLRDDGSEQWVRWEMQPWHKVNGEIGGIVLFAEDITSQKVAEQALLKSELEFRTLANAIPQLCWMATMDGGVYWYNQRYYDYTGATPEQVKGWGWQCVADPEALPGMLDRWKASLVTGAPFEMVFPIRRADGAFRTFLTRIMPVRDAEGKVVQWFGTNTDISGQLEAEKELRGALQQQHLAMEAAALGAWDYRVHTGDVFWDDRCRTMFGVDSSERFDHAQVVSRIHPEDRGAMEHGLGQAIAGVNGGAYSTEFRVVWPDHSVHWISSHGRAQLEGEDGNRQARVTGVCMDITSRKKAELEVLRLNAQLEQRVSQRTAELQATNKELEAFSYSVSHDLRAPLRGIDGWSLALAEDYADQLDERALQYLDRVRSETQRMGLLIDDLLQLSHISSSEMRLVPVDLTGIAQGIAAELAEANPGRRIEFLIEPDLAAPGDARLLGIMLTNLLSNAVKFTATREVARIEFGLARNGEGSGGGVSGGGASGRGASADGAPAFRLRDNGVGFDMAYAGGLFRAFQRLHKASEFQGTGIGLAIVQRVIHRHGGRVWTEAERDRGASFYFTIGTTT